MKKFNLLIMCISVFTFPSAFSQTKTLEELQKGPKDNSARSLEKWKFFLSQHLTQASNGAELKSKSIEVNKILKSCYPSQTPDCLKEIEHYSFIQANPTEYRTGKSQDPGPENLTINSASDLPDAFRLKGADGKLSDDLVGMPDDILKVAKQNGWKTVSYKTKSTGGFDGSPNLFIVAVPLGEGENKWDKVAVLQTSPHDDKKGKHKRYNPVPKPANGNFTNALGTLTVITIDKTQDPPVGQSRQLYKTAYDEGKRSKKRKVAYKWGNSTSVTSCTSCHTQPFRAISPLGDGANHGKEKAVSAKHKKEIDEMNAILEDFSTWGKVEYKGRQYSRGVKMDSQPYGWAPENSVTRTNEWLLECASQRRDINYSGFNNYNASVKKNPNAIIRPEILKEAMDCFSCHNGKDHGVLHGSYSNKEMQFKIAIHKTMPRGGNELTDDERLALISCLNAEFAAVKQDWKKSGNWMKGEKCVASSITPQCETVVNNEENQSSEIQIEN